jgi:hypothetical protein
MQSTPSFTHNAAYTEIASSMERKSGADRPETHADESQDRPSAHGGTSSKSKSLFDYFLTQVP